MKWGWAQVQIDLVVGENCFRHLAESSGKLPTSNYRMEKKHSIINKMANKLSRKRETAPSGRESETCDTKSSLQNLMVVVVESRR